MILNKGSVQGNISFYNGITAQYKLVWTIPDYLDLKKNMEQPDVIQFTHAVTIIPEIFSCQVQLYPHGTIHDIPGTTSIFFMNAGSRNMWRGTQFSLLDVNFQKQRIVGGQCNFLEVNKSMGRKKWLPVNYIEENKDTLLPNGSLQVVLQGTAYTSDPVVERPNISRDVNAAMNFVTFNEFTAGQHIDAILLVGEEEFEVNRNVLATRSSVFEELFRNHQNIVLLPRDVSAPVFRQVLQYIYSDTVTAEVDNMLPEIFEVAKKYNLDYLCSICEEKMCEKIMAHNAVEYLQLADRISAVKVKRSAINFIIDKKKLIIKDDSWKAFKSQPGKLLVEVLDELMDN